MNKKERLSSIYIAIIFIVSRVVFFWAGGRFHVDLEGYIQFLDPYLLKTRLWESIFYMHIQPPLFNLFLGTILKLFPENYTSVFQIIYVMIGFSFSQIVFLLMLQLGVKNFIAFILTVLFIINPGTLLYENWLFYPYPTAFILCAAVFLLCKYRRRESLVNGFLFFMALAILVLLRGTFFIGWFVLCFSLVLAFSKKKKLVVSAFLIPFLLTATVSLKNFIYFRSFSVMRDYQLASIAFFDATPDQISLLLNGEKITEITPREIVHPDLFGFWAFHNLNIPKTGIPVLDNFQKLSGEPNLNSLYHVVAATQFRRDAWSVLKYYPQNYFKALKRAFLVYCFPGPTEGQTENRQRIARYENIYNFMFAHLNKINNGQLYAFYLSGVDPFGMMRWDPLSIFWIGAVGCYFVLLFLFGLQCAFLCARNCESDEFRKPVLIFILFNILYVTCVSNFFSSFSNNRYRFDIDVFYWVLLGLFLTQIYRKIQNNKIKT